MTNDSSQNTQQFHHTWVADHSKLALSANEVAEMLGISRAHVWRLLSSGRIPRPVRLGRSVRWNRKTLEDWLEAGGPPRDRWENLHQGEK